MVIHLQGPNQMSIPIRLYNVAYCKDFATNLVSMQLLWKMGYYWDQRPTHNCIRRNDGRFMGSIQHRYGQFVLEYRKERARGTVLSAHKESNSWTLRLPRKADIQRWHLRLGHPGPQALEHLSNASRGVRVTGLPPKSNLIKGEGIKTVECDACATSKMKRQIRREPRQRPR